MDRKAFIHALPYFIPLPSSTVWPPEKASLQSQRRSRQQFVLRDRGQYVLSMELQDKPGKVLFFRKDEENDDPALTNIELVLEGDQDWMEATTAPDRGGTPRASTPSRSHHRNRGRLASPGKSETPHSSNTVSPPGIIVDDNASLVLLYIRLGEIHPPFLVNLRHLCGVEWVPAREINNNNDECNISRPESMVLCFDGPLQFRIFSTMTASSNDNDGLESTTPLEQFYNRLVTVIDQKETSTAHFYYTAASPATSSSRSASGQDQQVNAGSFGHHHHDNEDNNHSMSFLTDSSTKKRKDSSSSMPNQEQLHSKRAKAFEECLATYDSLWNVLQATTTAQTATTAASTIASLMTASAERQGALYQDNANENDDKSRRNLVHQDEWNKALQDFFPLRRGHQRRNEQQQQHECTTREETLHCIKSMMQQQKQAIQERCQVYLLPSRE